MSVWVGALVSPTELGLESGGLEETGRVQLGMDAGRGTSSYRSGWMFVGAARGSFYRLLLGLAMSCYTITIHAKAHFWLVEVGLYLCPCFRDDAFELSTPYVLQCPIEVFLWILHRLSLLCIGTISPCLCG